MAAFPLQKQDGTGFVATVDGELCAYLVVEQQPRHYQWELVGIAAGSPRLEATDDVCIELWTALIELAIQHAGHSGAKRLFAAADPDGPAYRSLRANGFEPYETIFVLTGCLPAVDSHDVPVGMRRQLNSDVWSVHQLYHLVTPRAVQFAEALTSNEWDLDRQPWWKRLSSPNPQRESFVLDTTDGVNAYCQIEKRHGEAIIRFMVAPTGTACVPAFLAAAARDAGVGIHDVVQIVVPGYAMEHISELQQWGFDVTWERTRLVKHTTAPVVVRPQLVPVAAIDERERAVRGVPSLYRGQ